MTPLHRWPLKFFDKGRVYQERPLKTINRTDKKSFRMKKISKRSSSTMLRSINQKIGVVKSNIQSNSRKINKMSASSDMFTPIVNSFGPVSKQIVSRYVNPKIIDLGRYPSKNPRFDNHKKFNQLPKREITHCVSVDSGPHLKAKTFGGSNCPPKSRKLNVNKSSKSFRALKRPSSAPTSARRNFNSMENNNVGSTRIMKTANSEIKALECSKKLYNIDTKFPNVSRDKNLQKINKKHTKKPIGSEIWIEGIPDTISLKCNSRLIQDINPQLFGSLSSSAFKSYIPCKCKNSSNPLTNNDKEKRSYFGKRLTKPYTAKINRVSGDTRRMKCFISKIPEQSLTRLKRTPKKPSTSSYSLESSSSYRKNRNLYCETNVILEENGEVEVMDRKKFNKSKDSSRDLAKRRNQEIKQKFKDMFKKKSKNNKENTDLSTPSVDESSSCKREKHIADGTSQPKIDEFSEASRSKQSLETEKECEKLSVDDEKEIYLQEFLSEFHTKNDEHFEKEFHKSLRRSFFTVSSEKSQNNSSLYETCRSHLSGDDLFLDNFSDGNKPPPPTPNDEEIPNEKEGKEKDSSANKHIEEESSSFHEAVNNEPSTPVTTTLDNLQNSPHTSTLARLSGKMSTEERSDVFQISQLSSDEDVDNKISNRKDGKKFSNSFIEQLCEMDESNFKSSGMNFKHKVKEIPSISDTYIDQTSHCDVRLMNGDPDGFVSHVTNKNEQNQRSNQRRPGGRWKSVPLLGQGKNCSSNSSTMSARKRKQSKTISSASNKSDSINSNMELLSEDSVCNSSIHQSDCSVKISNANHRHSSDISSLSESPSELLEESKLALERLMRCLNGPCADSLGDGSLNDILKDLSELDNDDTFRRMCGERIGPNSSSVEFMKMDEYSRNAKDIAENSEDDVFIRVSRVGLNFSRIDLHELEEKISSTVVYLKSPPEPYRISRESVPECLDGIAFKNDEN